MITFSVEVKTWLLILSSFLIAFALMFLRLPTWVEWLYPQWLVVVLLYWVFTMPYCVNVGIAWIVGFLLDILYNTPVGENALALVLATYFIIVFSKKIKLLDFWKKAAVIFGLFIWCQLLPLLLQVCLGRHFVFWPIFSRAIMSIPVWLFIKFWFENLFLNRVSYGPSRMY